MQSVTRVKKEASRANETEKVKWYDGPMFGYAFRTMMILIIYIRLRRGAFLGESESICGGLFNDLPPLFDNEDLWQTFTGLLLMDLDLTVILSTVIHEGYTNTDVVKAFSLLINLAGIYYTAAGLTRSPSVCQKQRPPRVLQRTVGRNSIKPQNLPMKKLKDFLNSLKNPAGIQTQGQ